MDLENSHYDFKKSCTKTLALDNVDFSMNVTHTRIIMQEFTHIREN